MDFKFTREEDAFRQEAAAFIEKEGPKDWHEKKVTFWDSSSQTDWVPELRKMAQKLGAKGWLSLHWPKQYGGQELSPFYRLILREELTKRHCPGYDTLGAAIVAPALLLKGTEEQKQRFLPGIAQGKDMWCETLSEPGYGSDLAGIETFAREEKDCYVLNGQKIWTTNGHFADWNAVVARTDRNVTPKHKGITMFLLDQKTPGITVNPIINMAGHHDFNEVFFDEVKVPKENILGGLNQGFYVVMALLDYERMADIPYAVAATLLNDIADYARTSGLMSKSKEHLMAELLAECEVAKLKHYHVTWMQSRGTLSNYDSAACKLLDFELHQHVCEFGMRVLGPSALLSEKAPWSPMYGRVSSCYLRSVGHSLEQGTSEIDRDVIAQRGLGLPRLR